MARRRRRPTPSASAFAKKKVADAWKAWMHFLLTDFPSLGTFITKDYEKADLKKSKKEREESMTERFADYQRLCLFGFGSMFWSSVTSVLADIEQKQKDNPDWKNWTGYYFIYSAVALLLMLVGLAASTFTDTCWFAPSLAGLGALQAVIFVLGAFHIDSLKYHSNVDQCYHFMIGFAVAVIFFWGWSIQDPMPLHIISKLIVWLIGIICYGVWLLLHQIYLLMKWFFSCLGGVSFSSWEYIWTGENSIKNRLVAWYRRTYERLPQHAV